MLPVKRKSYKNSEWMYLSPHYDFPLSKAYRALVPKSTQMLSENETVSKTERETWLL